jgi:hypothetical protein
MLAFGAACAEGTQNEQLTESGLKGVPVGGSDVASAGSGGSGGSGSTAGGESAGTSSAAAGTASGGVSGSDTAGSNAGGSAGTAASGAAGAGGSAGSGGNGGNAGMASGGGQAPVGDRFVKLVAKSEQMGKPWSSVAELNVLTTGGSALSRSGWVVTADSEETDDEQAPIGAMVDGDSETFWHSSWEPAPNQASDAPLPHWVVVDLGTTQPVTGFQYLPRQVGINGRIKDYDFYVSKDGKDWGNPVKSGSFPDGIGLQNVTF